MARKATVELQGKDELRKAFAALGADAKREIADVTRTTLDEIRREARARIPVSDDKSPQNPYPSGTTREKVYRSIAKDGLSGEVGNKWFVARWLEYGTKARTTKKGASRGAMPARPWLFPAWELVRPRYLSRVQSVLFAVMRSAGGR